MLTSLTRRRVLSVLALSAALVLTGCSGAPAPTPPATSAATIGTSSTPPASSSTTSTLAASDPTAPTTPTTPTTATGTTSGTPRPSITTEASGALVGRSGDYSLKPLAGWQEVTERAGSVPNVDLVVLAPRQVSGFGNNIVVITIPGDRARLDAELTEGAKKMTGPDRRVSKGADITVAGVTATGFQTAYEEQGVKVLARSYGMQRNGTIYLLTLSSSQQDAPNAAKQFDQILRTWAWK